MPIATPRAFLEKKTTNILIIRHDTFFTNFEINAWRPIISALNIELTLFNVMILLRIYYRRTSKSVYLIFKLTGRCINF